MFGHIKKRHLLEQSSSLFNAVNEVYVRGTADEDKWQCQHISRHSNPCDWVLLQHS